MKLSQVPPTLQRALALHELLRRLGFAPGDIGLDVARGPEEDGARCPHLFVLLKLWDPERREQKSFPLDCGEAREGNGPFSDLQGKWNEAMLLWNAKTTPTADKARVWARFMPKAVQDSLVLYLAEAGVEIPKPPGGWS